MRKFLNIMKANIALASRRGMMTTTGCVPLWALKN